MKVRLVYRDRALGAAWRERFGGYSGVEVIDADITAIECDAVVSPANSFGFMDGGLDFDLSLRFGWDLQKRLQEEIARRPMGELLVGEALVVPTGDATVPWLVSAPTMRVPMVLRQSVNAYLAMKASLLAARDHAGTPRIRSLAVPGLGTGVGTLAPELAARQMAAAYEEVVLGHGKYPPSLEDAHSRHLGLTSEGRR